MKKTDVYFSFHYKDKQDFRANAVIQSFKFRSKGDKYRDVSITEEVKEDRVKVIRKLIDTEIKFPHVTCVLIGSETYLRRWVRYEIVKSFVLHKGIVGVGINWIGDKNQNIKLIPGENPLEYLKLKISSDGKDIEFFQSNGWSWSLYKDFPSTANKHFPSSHFGKTYLFSKLYKKYSYKWDDGKTNFLKWIDEASKNIIEI